MARILVVDDEPDIVRFAVNVLEGRGHDVSTAADGPEALEAARGLGVKPVGDVPDWTLDGGSVRGDGLRGRGKS